MEVLTKGQDWSWNGLQKLWCSGIIKDYWEFLIFLMESFKKVRIGFRMAYRNCGAVKSSKTTGSYYIFNGIFSGYYF